eukprot:scaffold11110_cov101-Isochrysis_galbana.AAC.4
MFTVGMFTVGMFTVGMFTVGLFTVGMFTVGIRKVQRGNAQVENAPRVCMRKVQNSQGGDGQAGAAADDWAIGAGRARKLHFRETHGRVQDVFRMCSRCVGTRGKRPAQPACA